MDAEIKIKRDVIQSWYGRDESGVPLRGKALLDFALAESGTNKMLLSFSAGKDSLATWLYLLEDGRFEIIPYFLYWVPGMQFVEEALAYYEDFFGTHIIRLPHPLLYQYLNDFVFQPPERVAIIRAMRLPNFDFADIDDVLAHHLRLGKPFTAIGMRYYDNMQRRWLIEQQGAIGNKRRRFLYPIWDWRIDDVAAIIKRHNVKLPRDYAVFGRTLAAFDYQYLKPLREYFPDDYQRLLDFFPLAELEIWRYEVVGNGKNTT